jgi:hypothetical protein
VFIREQYTENVTSLRQFPRSKRKIPKETGSRGAADHRLISFLAKTASLLRPQDCKALANYAFCAILQHVQFIVHVALARYRYRY